MERVPSSGTLLVNGFGPEEASRLQAEKIRALLRANDEMRKVLAQAKREGKDCYRVKLIKSLRGQAREQEAFIEALKEKLLGRGMSLDELVDLREDCLRLPKLAGPPSIEQLQRDVASLKKERAELKQQLLLRARESRESKESKICEAGSAGSLREDAECIRAELTATSEALKRTQAALDELRRENSGLTVLRSEAEIIRTQASTLATENTRMREELISTVKQNEELFQEVRLLKTKSRASGEESVWRQLAAAREEIERLQRDVADANRKLALMETEVAAKKAVAAQLEERFRMRCEAMERQRAEELRQERARSTAGRQEEIDSLRAALANANAALAQAKAAAPPSQPLATQPPRSAETDDALRAQIAELEQDNHELEQTVRYQEQEIASLESKLAELQAQASLEDNAATQLDARTAPVGGTGASSNTSDGSMRQGLLRGTSPAPAEALAVDSSPSLSVVRSDEKREEAALAQTQNDKHESDKGGGMTPGNNLEHQFHSAHDADSISSVATVPSAEEAVL